MSFVSGFGKDIAHGIVDSAGDAFGGEVGDAVGKKVVNSVGLGSGNEGGVSGPERGVGLEEPPDDVGGDDSGDDGSIRAQSGDDGLDGGDSVGSFSGVGSFNNRGFDDGS